MIKERRNRALTAGIAAVSCCALLLSGTLAWTSFSQTAMNEVMGDGLKNPGGRLHDDFNGNEGIKKIYVENFSDELDGTGVIVRVRLWEYMELGKNAGDKTKRTDVKVLSNGGNAKIDDTSTWDIYKKYGNARSDHYGYWTWEDDGGSTAYMPTFNMNKDSKAADINGSYAGTGKGGTAGEPFSDYTPYVYDPTGGNTSTEKDDEIKDADDNDIDEGASAVEGENITTVTEQTHTAKMSKDAEVISMDEWKNTKNSEMGAYWVYDDDGWAYWAEPLAPKEATGLLLKGIEKGKIPQKWYYAIYVEGQIVDAEGVGSPASGENTPASGFYSELAGGAPSADAQTLLKKLVDKINEDEGKAPSQTTMELSMQEEELASEIQKVYEATLAAEAAEAEKDAQEEASEEKTQTGEDFDGETGKLPGTDPKEEAEDTKEPEEPKTDTSEKTPSKEDPEQTPSKEEDPAKDKLPSEDADTTGTAEGTDKEVPADTKNGALSTLFGLFSVGVS